MTTFNDSPKTVTEIAKNVIMNGAERSIPLTPENFNVWFEYFRDTNKELKTAIGQVRRPIKQFAVRSLSIAAAH